MKLKEYQEWVEEVTDTEELEVSQALGVCGEAGEVAELIKKFIYRVEPDDPEYDQKFADFKHKLSLEIGDVMWYLTALLNTYGLKWKDVLKDNVQKISVRRIDKAAEEAASCFGVGC